MRPSKTSQEYSQQIAVKKKYKNNQNEDQKQQYLDDQDPINCPLIFKAILLTLITIGILAFIITFAQLVVNSSELYTLDFTSCGDSSNLRRVSKYYAYQKMIMGLSICGLIFAFGLTVFLIIHAYDFCRCFDNCYGEVQDEQQSQSELDIQMYQTELKKRIQQNIAAPKSQMATGAIILPKKQIKQNQQQNQIKLRNPHIRKYLKTTEQIRKIDKQYNQNGGNSEQIDCDCQCDDIGSCMACFIGCLWCRTCFEAHHYRFYKQKNQEYAYWLFYLVKTLFFGTALAYVIRIYVSITELDYCSNINAKQYANNLNTTMVIGIITVCIDLFGYFHLLIQGSLLELVEDTLNEKAKSENSQQSDPDEDSQPQNKKKKSKKYKQSSSDNEDQKHKKRKKVKKQSQHQQSLQSQQLPTRVNLFSSIKKQKNKQTTEPLQKPLPSAKDTDSFFIKLKTLGNKYMEDISNQQQSQSQQKENRKKKGHKDKRKQIVESQQSYQRSNNKKPDIFVPKDIDQLPRFQNKNKINSVQEQSGNKNTFWNNQFQKKTEGVGMFIRQNYSQGASQQIGLKRLGEKPVRSGTTKFGAFNRGPTNANTFTQEPINTENLTQFQKLSKLSTKF